jgi:hypothetical protein
MVDWSAELLSSLTVIPNLGQAIDNQQSAIGHGKTE